MPFILTALFIMGCKNNEPNNQEHNHNTTTTVNENVSKKKTLSPHTETMAMIGEAHIHIDYSSPGVRDRIIFGGLLAYDQVWQAGAHMATWIETNKDLLVEDKMLAAGKYGFFTIPSKDEWTIIFNSNWEQHGKDEYDEEDDILRLKVKPTFLDETQEHLEYVITKTDNASGTISLAWEKVKVTISFSVIE